MAMPSLARGAAIVASLLAMPALAPGSDVAAQPSASDAEQQLAERFAPVIVLKEQDEECDTYGEPFAPMAVDALLDNVQVALRQVGNGDPLVMRGPSASDLFGLGEGFYLDFPGDALQPGCLYERDFRRHAADSPVTIYAHVVQQPDRPDLLAVQYWLFWYYNDWNNKHESDWEFIQLLFEASSVEEALAGEPSSVGYAQHEGGERHRWDSDALDRDGTHPVVYSSARSHASYFGSALFMGRSGSEGFGCDNTDGPSTRVDPAVVVLPDAVDDSGDPLAWLEYDGRWGERNSAPNNGPTGPAAKARWTAPVDWEEGLRDSSFVVPTGDSQATELIGAFCGVVEWGSVKFIEFQSSPLRIVISLAVLAALAVFLIRRTSWDAVTPIPVVERRRAGEIARASLTMYGRHPGTFAATGLAYLPIAALAGLAGAVIRRIPLIGDLVTVSDTGDDASRLVISALISGLANVVAFVVIAAAVAWIADRSAADERPSVRTALAAVGARAVDLGSAFLLALVIVVALDLTVILIPFAVHRLVRYQFLAQTVMVEDLGGRRALARSSNLVRGRWWHTALIACVVMLMIGGIGFLVGLLLLVLFTELPLWTLSLIMTVVSVLVMPLGAIVMTLLYGDAVAELGETEQTHERALATRSI